MSARVCIEHRSWGDVRFALLARICGHADAHHALIKCARIWQWQTDFYTPEAPTYVVPRAFVVAALGDQGPDGLVRSGLAVEEPEGFRMKGSKGRIERLYEVRANGRRGSEAAKRSRENKDVPPGTRPKISTQQRFEVLLRDYFTCRYCGQSAPDVPLEVDHVVPRSRGGTDDLSNLTTACFDCNNGKSDRLVP